MMINKTQTPPNETQETEGAIPGGIYRETTRGITIAVEPFFLSDQSDAQQNHFVWAYHVRIENNGDETVQLTHRHWKITDSAGTNQEVSGEGVVGEQPTLKPGEHFEYTSGTPLSTPSGIMLGTYTMALDSGEVFPASIPAFSLDSPFEAHKVH